jgi:hypothetical protein
MDHQQAKPHQPNLEMDRDEFETNCFVKAFKGMTIEELRVQHDKEKAAFLKRLAASSW